jgi:enoyl-[acyl-carrier protein] reductase II
MMSRVAELLGCEHPVIQGATGVISNPEMVAAVSSAGGFGLLATAFAPDVETVRDQIRATKELTDRPFGANLQVMNPNTLQLAEVLADEEIPAVTVSGGSPRALIPLLQEKGIKTLVVVPTVEVARKAAQLGADAIIAEGTESGGIQGLVGASTMVLVPAVVDAVDVPVIAAGGIADSRSYRAALALGAEGVQVGTRFIACRECVAHEKYKTAILESAETGTGLLHMGRFQVRALRTPLLEEVLRSGKTGGGAFGAAGFVASWIEGDLSAGALPAGEVVGLIHEVLTAREIIDEMVGAG